MHDGLSLNELAALLFSAALLISLLVWVLQSQEERWSKNGRVARLAGGWKWKGPPPTTFTALKRLLLVYVFVALVAVGSIALWAPREADTAHPVPFRTRSGQMYYVQRWVGRAIELAIPVGVAFVAGLALVGWYHREQLERYDRGAG